MGLIRWVESRIRTFSVADITIFKICLIAFTLMVAKLWPDVLVLDWYWYAAVFVITYIWIAGRMLGKRGS